MALHQSKWQNPSSSSEFCLFVCLIPSAGLRSDRMDSGREFIARGKIKPQLSVFFFNVYYINIDTCLLWVDRWECEAF